MQFSSFEAVLYCVCTFIFALLVVHILCFVLKTAAAACLFVWKTYKYFFICYVHDNRSFETLLAITTLFTFCNLWHTVPWSCMSSGTQSKLTPGVP